MREALWFFVYALVASCLVVGILILVYLLSVSSLSPFISVPLGIVIFASGITLFNATLNFCCKRANPY